MSNEFVKCDSGNVFVDHWDNGGVWLSISIRGGSARAILTREQAMEVMEAMQKVLSTTPEDCSDEVFE
jgi:hypothetical protein